MLKSFKRRLAELEALEAGPDVAAYHARVFDGFDDVRGWLDGSLPACDPRRVHQLIRLELGGPYNTWVCGEGYAEALYQVVVACILTRRGWEGDRDNADAVAAELDAAVAADSVCAVWEHSAALCWAVAEQGEPVTFRGETGSLIGLSCGLPSERPARPQGVLMADGRWIPLGGEHGTLYGGSGEPYYLLLPDGTRQPWPPDTRRF